MNRPTILTGLSLVVALGAMGAALRMHTYARADRILEGEGTARETLMALHEASLIIVKGGKAHPGLQDILSSVPGLVLLEELSVPERAYAQDETYVYGLVPTTKIDGSTRHGYVLRAWPREFGSTGDYEYYMVEDGKLYEGVNQRGRSGVDQGFPPPFPDPQVGMLKQVWWPYRDTPGDETTQEDETAHR